MKTTLSKIKSQYKNKLCQFLGKSEIIWDSQVSSQESGDLYKNSIIYILDFLPDPDSEKIAWFKIISNNQIGYVDLYFKELYQTYKIIS